ASRALRRGGAQKQFRALAFGRLPERTQPTSSGIPGVATHPGRHGIRSGGALRSRAHGASARHSQHVVIAPLACYVTSPAIGRCRGEFAQFPRNTKVKTDRASLGASGVPLAGKSPDSCIQPPTLSIAAGQAGGRASRRVERKNVTRESVTPPQG